MKILLTTLAFVFSNISFGQFDGTWYAFKVTDLVFVTINSQYLIRGTILNYNTSKQYFSKADTFTLKHKFTKGDSTLYLVTNKEPDFLSKYRDNKELFIDKFRFNKSSQTLSTYFSSTLEKYFEMTENKKQLGIKEITEFVEADTSNDSYLTYFKIDSINVYLKHKKLIEQPKETIIELYKNLTSKYEKLKSLSKDQLMTYAGLGSMLSSAIEVPEYLKLNVCPLLQQENFDEVEISEKFKDDKDVLIALSKFRRAKTFR